LNQKRLDPWRRLRRTTRHLRPFSRSRRAAALTRHINDSVNASAGNEGSSRGLVIWVIAWLIPIVLVAVAVYLAVR
jgi:hypothetical protein